MPRRYWLSIIAAVGIALAGAVYAQPVGDDAGGQTRAGQTQEKPQSNDTPRILDAINGGVERLSRALETLKSEPKTATEERRQESDLKAQWEMARWTENAVYVAIGALILTALGILLLIGTLVYTKHAADAAKAMVIEAKATTQAAQDSVEEARKATKFTEAAANVSREALLAADRAWIQIEVQLIASLVFGKENITTKAEFTFRNIGKSPAIYISVAVARMFSDIAAAAEKITEDTRGRHSSHNVYEGMAFGKALFPGEYFTFEREVELPARDFTTGIEMQNTLAQEAGEPDNVTTAKPAILIGVRYVLPGDKRYRFTYIPLEIEHKNSTLYGWDGSECSIGINDLNIKQSFISGYVT
jgi:hypothetical protein